MASILRMNIILNLWNELVLFFKNEFTVFDLTPQDAFLGFLKATFDIKSLVNLELLLI